MKLYEVEITKKVYVVAEDDNAAYEVANSYEVQHCDDEPEVFAHRIDRAPEDVLDSIPYGPEDGSDGRDRTIRQWLKSGEIKSEAEETAAAKRAAEFAARQLAIPGAL